MKYVSVQEMVLIEKAADAAGYSYQMMMEAAGRGLAAVIQEDFGPPAGRKVTALVGSGNNGGDALVALSYLLSWGWTATALLVRDRLDSDPLLARVSENGCRVIKCFDADRSPTVLEEELLSAKILIDGVLGTGIKFPIKAPLDKLLGDTKKILQQASAKPIVIAVDCPSGINCDTGEIDPAAFPADLTVIMAAVKQGLLKFPAYQYLGEIRMVDIGIPKSLPQLDKISREIICPEWVESKLPERPPDAHKGDFGTALIIAGSVKYPGASILAGESAYRIGTGLVTIAVPAAIYPGLIGALPEATWIKLDDQEGQISSSASTQIKGALGRPTACLIGPGLGSHESTRTFLENLLQLKELPPLVLDADGLRLLRGSAQWPELIPRGSVLTPHPGEMSALTGLSVQDIQTDRIGTAEHFALKWNQIVVLKGAHTVIAGPQGLTKIVISAEPALARAGSGDVLGGIITGFIAQGLKPFDAAACGVWIHARAGKLASESAGGAAAVLAGDIARAIGKV